MFGDLEPFGIVTRYVNKVTAEEIEPLINEKTKAVFAELIGNPGLEIADLDAVSELVHSHGVPLIIDSTTATPYLIQPFEHGRTSLFIPRQSTLTAAEIQSAE